jgi:hypothetical protein
MDWNEINNLNIPLMLPTKFGSFCQAIPPSSGSFCQAILEEKIFRNPPTRQTWPP